jgi:hypothetical protein
MKKFDYSIKVEKLDNPIGSNYSYVAKLNYLYQLSDDGDKTVDHQSNTSLGEAWGVTRELAYSTMEKKVKAWIDKQNKEN